jgi:hypothetical protein
VIYYLALRTTPATSSGLWGKFVAWLIKARLVSAYCHSGVLVPSLLAHATPDHGVHLSSLTPEKWELYPFSVPEAEMRERLKKVLGKGYDYFSQLAFVGFKATDSKRVYCFELCYILMTGKNPTGRVTPETLLRLCLQSPA